MKDYHNEYLSPIDDSITDNLEKNASHVEIDYIEWYWDCINEYILTNPNAFGSAYINSNIIQLPYTFSFDNNVSELKGGGLNAVHNELKYLMELGEIINAYIYRNISIMGREELEYILDSITSLHLLKSQCLRILSERL